MNCEQIRMQIPEYLADALDPGQRAWLESHVGDCATCRGELDEMSRVWRSLEPIAEDVPTCAMRTRFAETLAAYRVGAEQRRFASGRVFAIAASLLGIGLVAGQWHAREISRLRSQIEDMRQTLTLALLQEPSASDRLRGVMWSDRIEPQDGQVEAALLHVVNHDANVNVRLAAVDALAKFAKRPGLAKALVDALPVQDSPLVQIALIDTLVQVGDSEAAPALKRLAQDSLTNSEVRQQAQSALKRLHPIIKGEPL